MVKFAELDTQELRRFQLKITEMLGYFDSVCKKHNISYYLMWGNIIGAVRHQGFIPWDDDLDVAIPREDYEKLIRIWNEEESGGRYVMCCPEKGVKTGFHIAQLRDASTTCIYPHSVNYDICHGIKMDICPIDGCPDGKLATAIQTLYANFFGLFAAQRVPNNASKFKKFASKVLLGIIRSDSLRYKIWTHCEKKVKKYKIADCNRMRCLNKHIFEKGTFAPAVWVDFEGEKRPLPAKYDAILRHYYGDYMKLPPEEARKPITEVVYLDLTRSYKEYKGKYYLTDNMQNQKETDVQA